MDGGLQHALGDGWLKWAIGGVMTFVVGGLTAWIAKRPIEQAGVLAAVNSRMESYMAHLEGELERIANQHTKCERRLDTLDAENSTLKGRVDQLTGEVRQYQQLDDSKTRVRDAI